MSPDWVECSAPECGASAPSMGACVRHEKDDARVAVELRQGLDARGVLVDAALWARLRAIAPQEGGRALLGDTRFDGATFQATDFGHTRFGRASFANATFEDTAMFSRSAFASVDFGGAKFAGDFSFHDVDVSGGATFNGAQFLGSSALFTFARVDQAAFLEAYFAGRPSFSRARFRELSCNYARFAREARFEHLTADNATFVGASFDDDVSFSGARCGDLRLDRIHYGRPLRLGPVTSLRLLTLEDAVFDEPVTVVAAANFVSLAGSRFREQARFGLRWAEVALERATFERPSMIAWTDEVEDDHELVAACAERGRTRHPRIVTVREADVDGLFLAGVDLRACRVVGTRNLDRLRVGSGCEFARSPRGRRWAKREVLAEEHLWRAARSRGGDWNPPDCHAPAWVRDADAVPPPGVIAELYRDLRKAREDHKDEPGAASFYYGEMEMRRHDPKTERAERWILTLYWLVAGYGLRASRALAALALTVLVFAAIFAAWGFTPDQGPERALLFSAESTSGLFRVPPTTHFELTPAGEVAQLAVRLLGPLFFALALISLRGRVKRG
jgi:uncharacterized protein YjbI with pentapeptide repeats